MQLTNTPGKLVLPFANAGAKNTIPTASQIGITAGAASLVDGFPPLTRTPIAAGGVPPSGLDMNGILYELSAVIRWANAGGGYAYDSTFANDSNVNGYPKGARVMRSDGLGYWFNTVENNTTDPEAAGAAAAGWVPDFTNGVTSVAMASANVTLTPLQYGKPIIVITGTLTANLNLIFPAIVNEWAIINNTTGPYTITCKTAAGTGLVVNTAALIVGDGTNIQSAVTDAAALFGETVATATGGTADAITATFAPVPRYASNGVPLSVRATAANATTTPTFTPNSGVIAAATIVKGNNLPLAVGDIAGAGHWLELAWDSTLSKWVLLNPATGVSGGNLVDTTRIDIASAATVNLTTGAASTRNINITGTTGISAFTVVAGLLYFVRFNASLTLTNGANIVTQTGANIVTQAGDTCILRATATNVVEVVSYVPAILNQQTTRSMVRLNTANGYGSTNTMIRRFTNVVTNQGSDITYADSATLGASFTINTPGVYAITYVDNFNGTSNRGISLNSANLTTEIGSVPISEVLSFGTVQVNYQFPVQWTGFLPAGSVIRAHAQAVATGVVTNGVHFTITRVA